MKSCFAVAQVTIIILCGASIIASCAPIIAGGAIAGTAVTAQDKRSTGALVDDQGIEIKAQLELQADSRITKDRHVNVTSYNGIVLLTGEASSEQQRELIGSVVAALDKVRSIHNYLQIKDVSGIGARSKDTAITTAIKGRMVATKELESLKIKVVTEASTVYLMGITDSSQADIATEIARTTRGVEKVVRLFELTDK